MINLNRVAMFAGAALGVYALSTGCGGTGVGGPGGNSVSGSINGSAFSAQTSAAQSFEYDQFAEDAGCPGNHCPSNALIVRISEDSILCDPSGSVGLVHAGKRVVDIIVTKRADAGTFGPGTSSGYVYVRAVPAGAACDGGKINSDGANVKATEIDYDQTTALVTLTATSPRVQGSFTAKLSTGAAISGQFDSPVCRLFMSGGYEDMRCVP